MTLDEQPAPCQQGLSVLTRCTPACAWPWDVCCLPPAESGSPVGFCPHGMRYSTRGMALPPWRRWSSTCCSASGRIPCSSIGTLTGSYLHSHNHALSTLRLIASAHVQPWRSALAALQPLSLKLSPYGRQAASLTRAVSCTHPACGHRCTPPAGSHRLRGSQQASLALLVHRASCRQAPSLGRQRAANAHLSSGGVPALPLCRLSLH